jgi:2-amino-4-hydroxy-6-hydroxymethyldihydropteridine diphosphokinase
MQLSNGQVVVSLGTDVNRDANIHKALDALYAQFGTLNVSAVYESRPLSADADDPDAPHYWNVIVAFQSDSEIAHIHQGLKTIELDCGRDRCQTRVAMDIDLLFVGDLVGAFGDIQLPRRDIDQCAYVVRPLSDLFYHVMYPGRLQTFGQLWEAMVDKTDLFPVDFVWQQQVISVKPPCLSM